MAFKLLITRLGQLTLLVIQDLIPDSLTALPSFDMNAKLLIFTVFFFLSFGLSFAETATYDNFNDGVDDGWIHYNPRPGAITFVEESGSLAFQMKCSGGSLIDPCRMVSINMKEPPHAKFHVEVDLLSWTLNWGEDIGLVARVQEPLPSYFLPKGYALLFRNDRKIHPHSRKLMIVKSKGGVSFPIFLAKGRFVEPAPDPTGNYRLKFWSADGKLWGQMIDNKTGEAIKMWDGQDYVDRISAVDDGEFLSGRSGLVAYVHIVSYKQEGVSPIFDNFYSGTEAPSESAVPAR